MLLVDAMLELRVKLGAATHSKESVAHQKKQSSRSVVEAAVKITLCIQMKQVAEWCGRGSCVSQSPMLL